MNKKLKATLAMLMCVVTVGSVAACGDNEDSSGPKDTSYIAQANYTTMADYKAYLRSDLDAIKTAIGDSVSAEVKAAVEAAMATGVANINAANDIPTAKAAYETA